MHILRIEHPVADFNAWKAAFDRDPIGRQQSGVRRYRVMRPVDDPHYVLVDLEFDDFGGAEAVQAALRDMWRRAQAEGLIGSPQARIVETTESKEY